MRGLPRLEVAARFEPYVRWTLWVAVVVGIGVSVVSFAHWYSALALSVILVALQQLLQRTIIQYAIPFIQPFPKFDYHPSLWRAMAYAFPAGGGAQLDLCGPAMRNTSDLDKLFELFLDWNYGSTDDVDNNICMSIVFENPGAYSIYIYPNPERPSIKAFFKAAQEEFGRKGPGKELHEHVVQFTMHKVMTYRIGSLVDRFIEDRQSGLPFWLTPFIYEDSGNFQIYYGAKAILKHEIKVKRRELLVPRDYEYAAFWRGRKPFS